MSAKKSTPKKPGRPASGITKEKPSLTLDRKIMKMARKAASSRRQSLSAFVEESVEMMLGSVVRELEAAQ